MIRVVAAVIEENGRILICQRRAGGPFALQWEFPGGKMRRSETPRAALIRELREELGVEARIGRQLCKTHHRYSQLADAVELIFFATGRPRAPLRNLAFQRITWAPRKALARYDFLRADRLLVSRIVRGEVL